VSWDEWIAWRAWYELQPWGEDRNDLRQAVGIAYQLAPYLPKERELPQLLYPYTKEDAVDAAELKRATEEAAQQWQEWERTRRRGKRDSDG
jgi:hypothetical protein